jgi:molybdopterin molybdotransferase
MRPDLFPNPIPFEEARRRVLAAALPISRTVRIALHEAVGRVCAQDVVSHIDVPPFDRAAMDGYAVRAADVSHATPTAPVSLTCVDHVFTGQPSGRTLRSGECAEIATGAPVPDGADAVVMVERTSREGDVVLVRENVAAGRNIGRRGADIAAGSVPLRAGDVVTPARAGAVAATGQTTLDVFDRPRVAVLSTGSEVTAPGEPLAPGHVYDVNSITLSAIAEQHGADVTRLDNVDDDLDTLVDVLRYAATHDVIVTSGGSSVGGRDFLTDAMARCGTVEFHGIAIKPGKPTLFGHIGTTPIFGMPGNPTSCLSNACILLIPFLRRVARLPDWQPVKLTRPLARAIAALPDRHQFYAVRLVNDVVEPAFKSSGDITSLASADGYIEVPAGSKGLEAGEAVTVTLL